MDIEIHRGVALWREKYRLRKTATDFLIEASLEKLKSEGIEIDEDAVLADRRRRIERLDAATLNDRTNSTPAAAASDQVVQNVVKYVVRTNRKKPRAGA